MVVAVGLGGGSSGFPAATTNGDVAEGPTSGPVSSTTFTEVPGLSEAVVIVVAKFGVG